VPEHPGNRRNIYPNVEQFAGPPHVVPCQYRDACREHTFLQDAVQRPHRQKVVSKNGTTFIDPAEESAGLLAPNFQPVTERIRRAIC